MPQFNSAKRRVRQLMRLGIAASILFALTYLPSVITLKTSAQSVANDDGHDQPTFVMPPAGAAYRQINYYSDVLGIALGFDTSLVNPWGIATNPEFGLWVANNAPPRTATRYCCSPLSKDFREYIMLEGGSPTGVVSNPSGTDFIIGTDFRGPARFIFVSTEGDIAGWALGVPAPLSRRIIVVKKVAGQSYTGLAVSNKASDNYLYAVGGGHIDVFDKNFAPVTLAGNFTDPTPPTPGTTYSPYNIQELGGKLYVAYTGSNGGGCVSVFNFDGTFVSRLVSDGPLHSPWGLAIAPSSFGIYHDALLVGNSGGSGASINAFDPNTGAFLGSLNDEGGHPIVIENLRALKFDPNGNPNTLYFTAGIAGQQHGLLGALQPTTSVTQTLLSFSSPDYTAGENDGHVLITVNRTGDISGTSTVRYAALTQTGATFATESSVFVEGTPVEYTASFNVAPRTKSFERKPGGASGSTQDTGDNAADFQVRSVSDPQNLSSPPTPAGPVTPGVSPVVISEYQPFGPTGDRDFFVELYNNSNSPVNIGGWMLLPPPFTQPAFPPLVINGGTVIPPRGHFLAVGSAYSGSVPGDQTITTLTRSLDRNDGLALAMPDGTIVDQLGVVSGDFILTPGTLTFNPGETSKTIAVSLIADSLVEGNETLKIVLNNPTGAGLSAPSIAELTILNAAGSAQAPPTISINDVSLAEGNSGVANATFTVNMSAPSGVTTTLNFATADGSATSASDYAAKSGTINFAPGQVSKTITVQVNGDAVPEADEVFFVNLSNAANATITDNQGVGVILNDDVAGTFKFGASATSIAEDAGRLTVTVTRTGDTNGAASVNLTTTDGTATQKGDYIIRLATLTFGPGETSKSTQVFIIDDSLAEGSEDFTITLSNATNFFVPVVPSVMTVTITDNDVVTGANPIFTTPFFIRQLYLDFLNREPEPNGFNGWINILNNCPAGDKSCDRVEVASAFYRSEEFQKRGYFLYRFYGAALGRVPKYTEFMLDMSRVTGFLSDAQLEAAKQAFVIEFMNRQEFRAKYDGLSDSGYVNTLEQTAGVTLANKQQLIDALAQGTKTRAEVLRMVIEGPEVTQKFFKEAFVVEAYFGFLRRDPDIAFQTWIQIFNQTNDYRVIVDGFVNSSEYRQRFGP